MNKSQMLKLHSCKFAESKMKSTKTDKIYDLESFHIVSTELDLNFVQNPSALANLKFLDMNEAFMKVPDTVKLANLLHLTLSGNKCIKSALQSLGKGLNKLQTLSLSFSKRQRSDECGFPYITKYLPEESQLGKIIIDLRNAPETSYAISEIFEEDLTQICANTTVKFD